MSVLTEIVRHMTDRLVVMSLYYTLNSTAISNRLRNVPGGDPWNAHAWEVKS